MLLPLVETVLRAGLLERYGWLLLALELEVTTGGAWTGETTTPGLANAIPLAAIAPANPVGLRVLFLFQGLFFSGETLLEVLMTETVSSSCLRGDKS
jgi:hypothetical protein